MDNEKSNPEEQAEDALPTQRHGYGKRPMWQWVLLYIIVGGVVYAAIYFIFIASGDGGTNGGGLY